MLRVFAYIKCAAYSEGTPEALNSPRYQPKSGQPIQRSAAGHGLLHCLPQTLRSPFAKEYDISGKSSYFILRGAKGFKSASPHQTKDLTAHGQHYKYIEVIEKPTE